jgi:multidrug efflux system membrane fusion protein
MSESGRVRRRVVAAVAVAAVCVCVAVAVHERATADPDGSAHAGHRGAAQGPVPVVVAASRSTDVSIYLSGLGTVTASNTVTVKSRVDGQLMNLDFREGQMVSAGDALAELDPRPFQVQVTQAEGQLARDQAQLANGRVDLARYRTLLSEDSVTRQQLDTEQATVRQLDGVVKADQGQLDSARLQLSYSRIAAPIGGRVGLRQVDVGNMIHASDATGIVVITQLQPVSVVFSVPEENVQRIETSLRAGAQLTVEAWDRSLQHRLATGTLLTLDNEIDPTTGTIRLKAQFPNDDNALFPNQFVNARLLLDQQRNATVVPSAAILQGPQGSYVYVVNPDQTVHARPVTTGAVQGEDSAITRGLSVGERVVVDNTDKLRDGARVQAVSGEMVATTRGARPGRTHREGAQGQ